MPVVGSRVGAPMRRLLRPSSTLHSRRYGGGRIHRVSVCRSRERRAATTRSLGTGTIRINVSSCGDIRSALIGSAVEFLGRFHTRKRIVLNIEYVPVCRL